MKTSIPLIVLSDKEVTLYEHGAPHAQFFLRSISYIFLS
ncbi:hypothetical protein DET59_101373 [Rossellomorea aquimaris]|uniref:Uncharacterized protein n=1 Tax=Rossellomorea aquimaris TaxID=189382 RepID=A0A366F077_9BACI|nr:hypothetical protein DET59_101373 [Rossellomorea aquimaris]